MYAGTAQETALALVARKVTVSTQMDGLEVESQLEAAGAGDGGAAAMEVLRMGQALYEILSGQTAAPQPVVPVLHVVSRPLNTEADRQPLPSPAPRELPTTPPTDGKPQQLTLFDSAPAETAARRTPQPVPTAQERPQQLSLFDLFPAA